MGKCPICGAETFATDDPRVDICINFRAHSGQYYKLLRKRPRVQFDDDPELSPEVKEALAKACSRGGCDDG